MGIVYQTDKRSGITYAYSNSATWNKEKHRSESKRKLLGRVINMETKEYVPTDGRCKKRSPYLTEEEKTALGLNTSSDDAPLNTSGASSKEATITDIENLLKELIREVDAMKTEIQYIKAKVDR